MPQNRQRGSASSSDILTPEIKAKDARVPIAGTAHGPLQSNLDLHNLAG
jgi:hypothetical protein